MDYQRPILNTLLSRMKEPRKFIQVIAGPRQVGKTTIALELTKRLKGLVKYHSADEMSAYGGIWIDQIWDALRIQMNIERTTNAVLIIDEIQKIKDWSQTVKKHWDRDKREGNEIKLVLLGSSRLLLMDGLSESLMGRFEIMHAGHWGFSEMQKAFGFSAEQYMWFGGYPGSAEFVRDEQRFKEYIRNTIIESSLVRDILLMTKIDKPALLRQMFEVGLNYSGQIVSYTKMLGQLTDAGNTTTLARYLKLLEQAGLLSGLNKYNGRMIEIKGSIPKFQVHNTALLSAMKSGSFEDALSDPAEWGSIYESSVGAHLVSEVSKYANASLYYWRENNLEIDYVVTYGKKILGIEVKSGSESISLKASEKFKAYFPNSKLILVGKHGLRYEEFMKAGLPEII